MSATGSPQVSDRNFRFGPFELSEREGELRKKGVRIKLQEQPFHVLVELVANAGKTVSRAELQQKLWSQDTFVDFDTGLNTAMRKLRLALNDDADEPRYIETLARRGYRFIAPVSGTMIVTPSNAASPVVAPVLVAAAANAVYPPDSGGSLVTTPPNRKSRWQWVLAATVALALVIYGAVVFVPRLRKPQLAIEQRITANPPEAPVVAAVASPDGKYVAYADTTGVYIRLIDGGETRQLSLPKGIEAVPTSWFPDSAHLLLSSAELLPWGGGRIDPERRSTMWKVSLLGGDPQKLAENARGGAVSPDGSKIAFFRGDTAEIWLMGSDGGSVRRVVASSEPWDHLAGIAWSPSGNHMAYLRINYNPHTSSPKVRYSIETTDVGGGTPKIVERSERNTSALCWAPDGRLVYGSDYDFASERGDTGIWSVRVNEKTGEKAGEPLQISKGTGRVAGLSITADGKRLVLWRDNLHPTVFLSEIDSHTGQFKTPRRLTLDQNTNWVTAWTTDSGAVVFTSNRNGTFKLFRQAIDRAVAEVLVEGRSIRQPRLSPDGVEILYLAGYESEDERQPVRLMAVPAGGGGQRDVLQAPYIADIQCARSPSQLCLFVTFDPHAQRVYSFDPKDGKMEPFSPLEGASFTRWGLSPDGLQVALVSNGGPQRRITFVRLSDGSRRDVEVNTPAIVGMDWTADSKSVFVATMGANGSNELIRVEPGEERQVLLKRDRGEWYLYAIPSPDGSYAALAVVTGENNVWMIENF